MKHAKKIVGILFLLTLALAAYYIVSNIIASFVYFTSFPWWSAFVFAGYYFGPILLIEGALYCILRYRAGKTST